MSEHDRRPEDLCLAATAAYRAGDRARGDALWEAAKSAERGRPEGNVPGLAHYFVGALVATIGLMRGDYEQRLRALQREARYLQEAMEEAKAAGREP